MDVLKITGKFMMPQATIAQAHYDQMTDMRAAILAQVYVGADHAMSLDDTVKNCWLIKECLDYLAPPDSLGNSLSARKSVIRTMISDCLKVYINRMDDPVNGRS